MLNSYIVFNFTKPELISNVTKIATVKKVQIAVMTKRWKKIFFTSIPSFLRYAESVGAKHYHTSAKQNKGIEELFLDLCKSRYIQI